MKDGKGIRIVTFREGKWIELIVVMSSRKHGLDLFRGSYLVKITIPEG